MWNLAKLRLFPQNHLNIFADEKSVIFLINARTLLNIVD